jgi:hypothetical protein
MSFLRLKKALKDHSGSGMVVVLVTSFFIILLATTLLYAVLSSYYVRSSERRSNTNFDSADAGMDQIRAGLQEAVSDAVGEGYDYVLKNYSNGSPSDLFKNEYLKAIRSWSKNVNTATGMNEQKLFHTASGTTASGRVSDYNIDVLNSFLGKKVSGASYELTSDEPGSLGSGWGRATEDPDGNIVLKGIHLKFTNKGYETNITSDISLAMPDTGSMSSLNDANLNEYVIVADKGLNIQSPSACKIDGHMYTGEVNIGTQTNGSANGSLVINSGESLIVGQTKEFGPDGKANGKTTTGSVNLFGRMKYENNNSSKISEPGLTMENGSTLWAHDINVAGSSFNMEKSDSSKVYVADDLDIGRNAKVKLSGSYTGFGSEDNVSDPDAKAGSSSSILFSSTSKEDKSNLNLKDLKNLTLAGRSFVELNKKNTLSSNEVGMGSSITARNEQLCYLIPSDLMGDPYTNPAVVRTSTSDDGKISVVNGTTSMSLAAYIDSLKDAIKENLKPNGSSELIYNCGIKDKSNIKVLAYPVNGQSQYVLYAFMDFPTRADANKYFKSLFESNGSTISDYISQYVDLETATGSSTVMDTAGTSLENTGSDLALAVGQSSDQKAADPNNKTPLTSPDTFKNLSTTYDLYSNSMTTKTVEDTTPFNYYIDKDRLDALLDPNGSSKYKFSDGTNYRKGRINVDAVDAKGNKITVPISDIQTQNEHGSCTYRELSYYSQDDYSLIVAKGNYSLHGSDKRHIFIVDGDVYIDNLDQQKGLIMCTGKIYANTGFTFKVFKEVDNGWTHVTLLQNFGQGIWKGGTSVYDTSGDWTSADLVTYQNWKKNKD